MKTLIRPQALLSIVRTKASKTNLVPFTDNVDLDLEVGVFSSHRDVKVAIEELLEAGITRDRFTIIARNWRDRDWLEDLTVYDYFDEQLFGTNSNCQHFFQRLFRRGKYLLSIAGDTKDVSASAIMSRRRGHAEVWIFKNNPMDKIA